MGLRQRPLPHNARFQAASGHRLPDYDLAILHFDENVLAPENTNGVIGPEWGAAFKLFCEQIDLPKVAICHGTPQFYGQYNFEYAGADLMQPIEVERQRLVDYLGDIHVVCNSYQAQAEWQFRRSSVIWHGFDPAEFPPATYQRGILSPLDHWYFRGRTIAVTFFIAKFSMATSISCARRHCACRNRTPVTWAIAKHLQNFVVMSMNCAVIPCTSIRL